MNVSFTSKQENYIREQVKSGNFQNASEVVRDVLRLHEVMRERLISELKREIQDGIDSGVSPKTPQDIIAEKRNKYGN